jgi:hypothetical protein
MAVDLGGGVALALTVGHFRNAGAVGIITTFNGGGATYTETASIPPTLPEVARPAALLVVGGLTVGVVTAVRRRRRARSKS